MRACLICGTSFAVTTRSSDTWWCSEVCHDELVSRANARRTEELQVAEEMSSLTDLAVSEAEKARRALSGDTLPLGPAPMAQAASPHVELLMATSRVAQAAAHLTRAEDVLPAVDLALLYLGRVRERLDDGAEFGGIEDDDSGSVVRPDDDPAELHDGQGEDED